MDRHLTSERYVSSDSVDRLVQRYVALWPKAGRYGFRETVLSDRALAAGVNVYDGHVTSERVAQALGLEYTPVSQLLEQPSGPAKLEAI